MDEPTVIETARRNSGLTRAELARRAGTAQPTLSMSVRGLKSPSLAASLGPRDDISDVADVHLQSRKEDKRARVAVRIEETRRQLGY